MPHTAITNDQNTAVDIDPAANTLPKRICLQGRWLRRSTSVFSNHRHHLYIYKRQCRRKYRQNNKNSPRVMKIIDEAVEGKNLNMIPNTNNINPNKVFWSQFDFFFISVCVSFFITSLPMILLDYVSFSIACSNVV